MKNKRQPRVTGTANAGITMKADYLLYMIF
jgi:hypothetical protein